MKEDTNVANLLETAEQEVRAKFPNKDVKREIDIVLVVHAAPDPIPENLMTAVRNAAQPDEQGARGSLVVTLNVSTLLHVCIQATLKLLSKVFYNRSKGLNANVFKYVAAIMIIIAFLQL